MPYKTHCRQSSLNQGCRTGWGWGTVHRLERTWILPLLQKNKKKVDLTGWHCIPTKLKIDTFGCHLASTLSVSLSSSILTLLLLSSHATPPHYGIPASDPALSSDAICSLPSPWFPPVPWLNIVFSQDTLDMWWQKEKEKKKKLHILCDRHCLFGGGGGGCGGQAHKRFPKNE